MFMDQTYHLLPITLPTTYVTQCRRGHFGRPSQALEWTLRG
jgi:hypothetical protein